VQEPGTRLSMPLPYQPNASGSTDCGALRFNITLSNAGVASGHFAIYANAGRTDGPWQYDVAAPGSVNDSFTVATNIGGFYDFSCYGPNGFLRRFAGAVNLDCNQLEVTSAIDGNAGSITLTLQNSTATGVNFTIADGCGLSGTWTNNVPAGSLGTNVFFAITNNGGWYDLIVTADGDPQFLRRLAGHVETGSVTPTANYSTNVTIWVSPPTNSTPATNLPPFTLPASINPVPATNVLTLYGVPYGTNLMLVYPNWASNSIIEFSPGLVPVSWTPVNAVSNVLGNYLVVPQPLNLPAGFFRLRQ
ncbi:MAG TPA: phospholipase domain-containing protein, partial [Verrucomicrobiae bacterium]|nr:phospholipase domain-containing protein [Verrucomicrobiae bacterium]